MHYSPALVLAPIFVLSCLVAAPYAADALRESSVVKERETIATTCKKWDLAQAENGQYDDNSTARREGCQAAFLANSRHRENRMEGERRLAAALADGTQISHYANKKMQELER